MGRFKQIREWLEKYQDRIAILIGLLCVVFLASLFSSCSCNYHLARAAKKCPSSVVHDTITVHDTLKLPEVSHDTTFYAKPGDTVYVTKDRLKYRYINLGNNQHSITAKCDSVFVSRYIKVPYEKTIYKYSWIDRIGQGFFWIIVFVIVLLILWKVLK